MCRDSVAIGSAGEGTGAGGVFNLSVMVILGTFLAVAGLLMTKIVGAVRLVNRAAMEQSGTERNSGNVSQCG